MPPLVSMVVTSRRATLHELQTVYSLEDLHDLAEVVLVEAHNQRVLSKKRD